MTIREALVIKLEDFKSTGLTEESYQVQWIRQQIAAEDRRLLLVEVERLRETHSFQGTTIAEQLGADRWLLGGANATR